MWKEELIILFLAKEKSDCGNPERLITAHASAER
jgi:hypothetical protein